MTREILAERSSKELGEKYIKMFKTNLVAMSFYDDKGHLVDLNDNMRQLCRFDEEGERYFRKTSLFDIPVFKDDFDHVSEFHVCHHMYYSEIGLDSYIEFRIKPVVNDEGQIRYFTITARDISDERLMYREQIRHDREMRKVADEANQYEAQLNYLLSNSNMFAWRSNLDDSQTMYLEYSRGIFHRQRLAE